MASNDDHARTTLVLGGARSGKSRYAESLTRASAGDWVYLATAQAGDDEMRQRIAKHRLSRGVGWTTIEEPLALAEVLEREARTGRAVLVDCLTLWLSNLLLSGRDPTSETDKLIGAMATISSSVVFVSNEVGLGLVPETKLGRTFRDAQGQLNQSVAGICEHVVFVAAGLPLTLKDTHSQEAGS